MDGLIHLPGYVIFRKDGAKTRGGGVLLYVHESLKPVGCEELTSHEFQDSAWCYLNIENGDRLLVGVCYKSTSSTGENNERLLDLVKKAGEKDTSHLLLMGDFNFPKIDWANYYVDAGENSVESRFFERTQDMFLHQHVDFPTRFRMGQEPSSLDLVFTNEANMIDEVTSYAPLGLSDHVSLAFQFACRSDPYAKRSKTVSRNYFKGDYEKCKKSFEEVNWDELLRDKNVEDGWSEIKQVMDRVVSENIPLWKEGDKKQTKSYVKGSVKKLVKSKHELWVRYQRTKSYFDWQAYVRQRNIVTKELRKCRRDHERRLVKDIKTKPKAFYGYLNSSQKVKVGAGHLEKENGSLTSSEEEAAQVLCSFFQSVFVQEDDGPLPEFACRTDTVLNNIVFSVNDVKKKLLALKEDKAMGPDGMHPKLLKECAESLAVPFYIIFKKSISSGVIPADGKVARVRPIFKKGSRKKPGNFRPVSLTSVVWKMLESIIRDKILAHAESMLSVHQHGFLRGKSCLTNLLETLEAWTKSVDDGSGVDVVFLDYQKAFDTVPHKRLLKKLEAYGLTGKVLCWIKSFLTNRKMQVSLGDACSEWVEVSSGVPQGSVLGPLLFILYVNDIPEIVKSAVKMFADDAKLFTSTESVSKREELQKDLETLDKWSDDWLLKFNVAKCKRMHLGYNNQGFDYRMEGHQLERIEEEKDLGVWITSNMKPSLQCSKAAGKAMAVLAQVRKAFQFMDYESFNIIYRVYVRPHLEYCVQAWNPYLVKDIKCLERVQERATKIVTGLRHLPYGERLRKLKLISLIRRRERGDLIETFKIIKNLEGISEAFFIPEIYEGLRGHGLKLFRERARLEVRKNFFTQRVITAWNNLPEEVVNKNTVNGFKNALDRHWERLGYGYQIDH